LVFGGALGVEALAGRFFVAAALLACRASNFCISSCKTASSQSSSMSGDAGRWAEVGWAKSLVQTVCAASNDVEQIMGEHWGSVERGLRIGWAEICKNDNGNNKKQLESMFCNYTILGWCR
jgi:hypothetical protein